MSPTVSVSCGVPQGSILGPLLCSLYLLPSGTSFHCRADDCQINVPLRKNAAYSDVTAWTALNLLSFNEKKTEVIIFGPICCSESQPVNPGALVTDLINIVMILGFKLDRDFKCDKQISLVINNSFYRLRQTANVRNILSRENL